MTDIEFSKRLHKMNKRYIDHIGEDYTGPHMRYATASKRDFHLQGGFFQAIGVAARIAAAAAKAAARAAANAAKAGAKAAANAAKSGAKATREAVKQGVKNIKNTPKNIKNSSIYDKARGTLSAVEVAHDIQSAIRKGEPILPELWNSLDSATKAVVDIHKWEQELPLKWRQEFETAGGNQAAAFLTIRLMNEGPQDAISKQMEENFDTNLDKLLEPPLTDFADCDNEYGCGPPVPNCYGYGGPAIGWYWVSSGARAAIPDGHINACDSNASKAGPGNCGNQGAYESRKACLQGKADEIEKQREIAKKAFSITGGIPVDLTPEHIAAYNAAANKNFFQNRPELQSTALNNDFLTANGSSPVKAAAWDNNKVYNKDDEVTYGNYYYTSLKISNKEHNPESSTEWWQRGDMFTKSEDTIYKAQSMAVWMMENREFDLESVSQENEFRIWLKEDPSLYNRALAQTATPAMFLVGPGSYQNTKSFVASIGGGPNPVAMTAEQQRLLARYELYADDNDEIIDAARAATQQEDVDNLVRNAREYNPATTYNLDDVVKKAGIPYMYINNTPAAGKDPPISPTFWEKQDLYTQTDLEEIEKLGNAVMWKVYTKYNIGDYVKYMDDTFVNIKDVPAGTLPTDSNAWRKVDILDPAALDKTKAEYLLWNNRTAYNAGAKVLRLNKYYTAINNNKEMTPEIEPGTWQQVYMFTLTPDMKEELALNQRISTYTQAVDRAVEFELGQQYNIGDIVIGPDGNYYELIKQKKDRANNLMDTPRPPSSFWKLLSAGEIDYNDTTKFKVLDIVNYEKKQYMLIKEAPAGTNPTNTIFWKTVDAVFEEVPDDVKASYADNVRNADLALTSDFNFETDGYTEGDVVTIYDDRGVPSIWRCIKDYSLDYDATKMYPINAVVKSDGKYYKHIRQSDPGMALTNETYWHLASPEDVAAYNVTLGPPNAEFWADTSETTDEGNQIRDRNSAINWSVGTNERNKKTIKDKDIILDQASNIYYRFLVKQSDLFGQDPTKYIFDTAYIEPPKNMEEDEYLRSSAPIGLPRYRWDEMPELQTNAEAAGDNFDELHQWKQNKPYKEGDVVVYNTYYFLAIKDVPAGIIPYTREGVLNEVYYEYLDTESERARVREEYQAKLEDENNLKTANAQIQWVKGTTYEPGDLVFNDGKYFIWESYDGSSSMHTYEPGNEAAFKAYAPMYRANGGWFEADEDGNLKPEQFDPLQGYKQYQPGGTIVHYKDKQYVMNNRNKPIFGYPEGQFPEPPGAPGLNYGDLSAVPSDIDPTYWVEVYDDGTPVKKVDADGKFTGTNPAPTNKDVLAAQQAVVDPNSPEARAANCPTAEDDNPDDDETGDTHHDDVEAAKALEAAIIEWKAKGEQGPKPGTLPTGAGFDELEPVDYSYLTKTKRKYVRKNKNIKK